MILSELASALGSELKGDGSLEITGVAGMEHATSTEVTFLANLKYAPKLKHTRAAAVLVAAPVEGLAAAQLISSNPYLDFARALALFYQPPRPKLRGSSAGLRGGLRQHRRSRFHRTFCGGWGKCFHRP